MVLPDAANVGAIIVSSARTFARRHKIITGGYLFGILVLLFAGSGTKLTLEQAKQYNSIMNTINLEAEYNASHDYYQAQQAYHASKGWFSCDSLCQRNKERMNARYAVLQEIRQEGNARMSDAKSVAGLFSQVGVGEVKDSFWQYFAQGKQFAKRQSMWDAMFMGIRHMGRDESMLEYALRVLMQILVNFSMGLLMALVIFIIGLWSIIRSLSTQSTRGSRLFPFGSMCCLCLCHVLSLGHLRGDCRRTLWHGETGGNECTSSKTRTRRWWC